MDNTFRCSLERHVFSRFVVLAVAVGLFCSVSAVGQTGASEMRGGGFRRSAPHGVNARNFTVSPKTGPVPIEPFIIYTDASYGTGGIGLRNRGAGVLHVSGVTGKVQDAYLYWAILFNTPTPGKNL